MADKEGAFKSKLFTEEMSKLGVKYSAKLKAPYTSDRSIRAIREMAVQSMGMNKADMKTFPMYLRAAVSEINSRFIAGTHYRKKDVNKKNFYDYLNERYGGKAGRKGYDVTHDFNSQRINYFALSKKMRQEFFKFRPGETVLLATLKDPGKKGDEKRFLKLSKTGYYSPQKYRVAEAALRSNWHHNFVQG